MRLTCLVAALILSAGLLHAADPDPNAVPGLTQEETDQGFASLFDGKTLEGWQGSVNGYVPENGLMICKSGGQLFTKEEYADFIFRFDFKLQANGNNGVGIRTPLGCNPAYCGMEIQILDDSGSHYKNLQPYQFHGSIYGVVPCKRGHQNPVGEWNSEEIMCKGSQVTITLNGVVIVDADISKIDKPIDGNAHPGLKRTTGYIGWLGHGARIEFRNIRIKELK